MTDNPADTEIGGKDPNEIINDGLAELYGGKKRKAKDVLAEFALELSVASYHGCADTGCDGYHPGEYEAIDKAKAKTEAALCADLLAILPKRETIPGQQGKGKYSDGRNEAIDQMEKAIRNYFGEDR